MSGSVLNSALGCVATLFALLGLQGCKRLDCGDYWRFIEEPEASARLERWADEAIFSRSFGDTEFQRRDTGGPGPGPGNLKPDVAETLLPDYLKGYNVRLIGPDSARPSMVLIGARKYQGIMISRGELDTDLAGTRLAKEQLEGSKGRIGLLCLMPFE